MAFCPIHFGDTIPTINSPPRCSMRSPTTASKQGRKPAGLRGLDPPPFFATLKRSSRFISHPGRVDIMKKLTALFLAVFLFPASFALGGEQPDPVDERSSLVNDDLAFAFHGDAPLGAQLLNDQQMAETEGNYVNLGRAFAQALRQGIFAGLKYSARKGWIKLDEKGIPTNTGFFLLGYALTKEEMEELRLEIELGEAERAQLRERIKELKAQLAALKKRQQQPQNNTENTENAPNQETQQGKPGKRGGGGGDSYSPSSHVNPSTSNPLRGVTVERVPDTRIPWRPIPAPPGSVGVQDNVSGTWIGGGGSSGVNKLDEVETSTE